MSPRIKRLLQAVSFFCFFSVIVSASGVLWAIVSWLLPQKRPLDTVEVLPVLLALREHNPDATHAVLVELGKRHPGSLVFQQWLATVLVQGRTTQQEVILLFGPPHLSLDRPPRDGLITVEYELGGKPKLWLVLDFDARTGVLQYWEIDDGGVCGFCPHVFVFDGQWRLEGKQLAGCVGLRQEGLDTLLLPRLLVRAGRLRLKVSNLAPEVEYLDQVQLGAVPLRDAEELDVGSDGDPVVWRPLQEIPARTQPGPQGQDELKADLGTSVNARVLVLEARNTSEFKTAVRESLSGQPPGPAATALHLQLGDGPVWDLRAVGTKFLRRIVVPVPQGSGSVRLEARRGWWQVTRLWVGQSRAVEPGILWRTASAVDGPVTDACRLLRSVDQQRVRLEPGQELELTFPASEPAQVATRWGYVVRMTGYYEFLSATPRLEGRSSPLR
jgi:hypothetical protein